MHPLISVSIETLLTPSLLAGHRQVVVESHGTAAGTG